MLLNKEFTEFILKNNIIDKSQSILITVSGGIDSIILLDLFTKNKYKFEVAHCNFKLRGEDSEKDAIFVEDLCNKNNITFHKIEFETSKYAKDNGISIQMAARDLRYNWFEKIREENNLDFIATAHNKNDIAETMLLNIIRGTGINGLTGISIKNNKLIRPLLFASREEIAEYQVLNKIEFREDKSNSSTKYSRNKIRHNVIPILEEINPSFLNTMYENAKRFEETNVIYNNSLKFSKNKTLIKQSDRTLINIDSLKKLTPIKTYLYEFLKPYNFTNLIINDIINSLDSESGKIFKSSSHTIIKDREFLIITENWQEEVVKFFIDENNNTYNKPIRLKVDKIKIVDNFKISKLKNIAEIDYDLLKFPLILRKWQKGDYFIPLGMNRTKKLSDFFIDNKLSIKDKKDLWILESKSEIVWILNHRIDDRYKITDKTKNVFRLTISKT